MPNSTNRTLNIYTLTSDTYLGRMEDGTMGLICPSCAEHCTEIEPAERDGYVHVPQCDRCHVALPHTGRYEPRA